MVTFDVDCQKSTRIFFSDVLRGDGLINDQSYDFFRLGREQSLRLPQRFDRLASPPLNGPEACAEMCYAARKRCFDHKAVGGS